MHPHLMFVAIQIQRQAIPRAVLHAIAVAVAVVVVVASQMVLRAMRTALILVMMQKDQTMILR
jgi:hypothetical protein